jgi:mono/diheme cytochrome c family protein
VKHFVAGFVIAFSSIVIGPLALMRLGFADTRANVSAPSWARRVWQFAVHASVSRRVSDVRNPLAHSDQELADGERLYLSGCAGCHGVPGHAASARVVYLGPREFAHVRTDYSEPEMFWIIKHGIRRTGMSAYGSFYSDHQLWELAEFVSRLSRGGQ